MKSSLLIGSLSKIKIKERILKRAYMSLDLLIEDLAKK